MGGPTARVTRPARDHIATTRSPRAPMGRGTRSSPSVGNRTYGRSGRRLLI